MIRNLITICLFGLMMSCSSGDEHADPVGDQLKEIQAQYAPDKRVAIWQVDTKKESGELRLIGETQFPEAKQLLFKSLDSLKINYVDSIQVLPTSELAGMHFGIVRLPVANIRTSPKHSAELATQSTLGTPIRIWKKDGEWFLVQTPDKYLGWLDSDGVAPMRVEAYRQWRNSKKLMVTNYHAIVYEEPNPASRIVSTVLKGNVLERETDSESDYFTVSFPDGRRGYLDIYSALDFDEWMSQQEYTPDKLLATAQEFMGTPYMWGGTSPNAFDCSGFTKTVFYLNGMVIPRDASQQVKVGLNLGTTLDLTKWKKGDLLFFGRKATAELPEKITHVAIYMGNGKMIHAAGSVKIESLRRSDPDFAPQRFETFVRARRMLDVPGDNGVYVINTLPEYLGG